MEPGSTLAKARESVALKIRYGLAFLERLRYSVKVMDSVVLKIGAAWRRFRDLAMGCKVRISSS